MSFKLGAPHLVKIGVMGLVGRYESPDYTIFSRDTSVICRTSRGLEYGSVLCSLDDDANEASSMDGQVLRKVGWEDELILERLERHRDKAFASCQRLIQERQLPGVLVDVEHLFDGESVFFYFLGAVDERLKELTDELAATFERKVRFKKFAETLANGCGPDCGSGESQCSSGACGSCAVSGACGVKTKATS